MTKIALTVLSLLIAGSAALAEDLYVKKPYIATWEMKSPHGNNISKVYNDGQGHGRMEIQQGPTKSVSLIDWPGKKVIVLIEQGKMYMQMPLKEGDFAQVNADAQKGKVKDLGTKVIDGHLCKGALYNFDGTMSEQWVADDLKVDVQSTITNPKYGKTTRRMTSYQAVVPPADVFKIPSGYRAMPH